MAATADIFDDRALAFRVNTLERNETYNADKLARVDDVVQTHSTTLAVQHEQITGLTFAVTKLDGSVTWMTRALLGLCLTIAGSAGALVYTLG